MVTSNKYRTDSDDNLWKSMNGIYSSEILIKTFYLCLKISAEMEVPSPVPGADVSRSVSGTFNPNSAPTSECSLCGGGVKSAPSRLP